MKLTGKINALVIGGVVALGLASTLISIQTLRGAGQDQIAGMRERQMKAKEEKLKDLTQVVMRAVEAAQKNAVDPKRVAEAYEVRLKDLVDVAYGAIEATHRAQDGLSPAQKMERAKALVKGLRYGADDYFWINDTRPSMVMHPMKPELDGKDLSESKDPNGKQLFVEFVKVAEASGEGFVDYLWPRPGRDVPVPKLSYVKLFKPWNWIVGTGVYIEDAETAAKEDVKRLVASYRYGAAADDYFWINDTRPAMVMHPIRPELDGKDLSESKDPNGKKLFVEFVKVAEASGAGFVDYLWPKPGSDVPVPKLSYVALFKPWNWVIGTGVYVDDVAQLVAAETAKIEAATRREIWLQAGSLLLVTAVVGALAGLLSRRVVRPIRDTTAMLREIARGEGDLTGRLVVASRDELGEMAAEFNSFVGKLQTMIGDVAGHAVNVSSSSEELSALSSQMSRGADEMAGRSHTVAAASEEMSSNMNNVAAAMEQATANLGIISTAVEQMTSTIREIATNTEKASSVTSQAVTVARSASGRVDELGQAARLIGKVTQTINEISEQTKLLALNATIEAARAGEAGKGFAVVANEIKELARQTAAATEEIRGRVDGIQQSTQGTVGEIGQISSVIQAVNDIVTTIAAAVEEQSVTTRDIAANVGHASRGIHEVNTSVAQSSSVAGEIAREIDDVNQAAGEISNSTSQVSASAQDLSRLSARLSELVSRFRV